VGQWGNRPADGRSRAARGTGHGNVCALERSSCSARPAGARAGRDVARAPGEPAKEAEEKAIPDLHQDFRDLVDRHYGSVWACVSVLTARSADTEDLVHQAFLLAFERLAEGGGFTGDPGKWLRGTARHLVFAWWRDKRRMPEALAERLEILVAHQEDDALSRADRAEVSAALRLCLGQALGGGAPPRTTALRRGRGACLHCRGPRLNAVTVRTRLHASVRPCGAAWKRPSVEGSDMTREVEALLAHLLEDGGIEDGRAAELVRALDAADTRSEVQAELHTEILLREMLVREGPSSAPVIVSWPGGPAWTPARLDPRPRTGAADGCLGRRSSRCHRLRRRGPCLAQPIAALPRDLGKR